MFGFISITTLTDKPPNNLTYCWILTLRIRGGTVSWRDFWWHANFAGHTEKNLANFLSSSNEVKFSPFIEQKLSTKTLYSPAPWFYIHHTFVPIFFAVAKPSYSVQWLDISHSVLCFIKWLCMSPWKHPSYCLYTCEWSTPCCHCKLLSLNVTRICTGQHLQKWFAALLLVSEERRFQ